ncbi:type II toxin-antitoxin system RelE/ParE family toxin [Methylobacterium sp. C25]|uniref:type II toxin-antitoxin system RelE/ParE family toxin n=1 Tax=Methylobacterium sp. C25 TaxID=2721622 RepID=UPI001F29B7A1|nr:type II toxin-antitoxin system RelE/ParE family toxin [Methylobacterium sp. C25]MCE4226347.1 type II toxin-antitoxin system RelE/ParE family toxin [Methylobacterium sp. C25]
MANIVRRPRARLDLLDVWDYIADDNEAAADSMLDRIDRALNMLSDNPGAGRARPELADALRSFPVGNYVLYYLPAKDGIELVRVLSGYRDIGTDDFE